MYRKKAASDNNKQCRQQH